MSPAERAALLELSPWAWKQSRRRCLARLERGGLVESKRDRLGTWWRRLPMGSRALGVEHDGGLAARF